MPVLNWTNAENPEASGDLRFYVQSAGPGSGVVLRSDGTALISNLSPSGIGQERYVVKPVTTNRASTITLADDPALTATVVANGVYYVKFVVFAITANAAVTDIQTAWNIPAGTSGLKACIGSTDSAADFTSRTNTRARFSGHSYVTAIPYQLEASAVVIAEESIITMGATPGSITLQWAQTVSDAANVTVFANSYMYIKRVG